jgi:hypothetical protein
MGSTDTARSGVNLGESSGLTESTAGQQHVGNGPGWSLCRFCGILPVWSWQHVFLPVAGALSGAVNDAVGPLMKQHHPGGGTRRSPQINNSDRIAILITIYSSS